MIPLWEYSPDCDSPALHASPPAQVAAFVGAALSRLLPPDTFGVGEAGKLNSLIIHRAIQRFIWQRKGETLSLGEVLEGIKVCGQPHALENPADQ